MYQCILCKQTFINTHHPNLCRDYLINEIVDDLDNIHNLSIIKKVLDFIKTFLN